MNTSYSPFIIGLSMIFLHERLTLLQIIGVLFILNAVVTVSRMREGRDQVGRDHLVSGVLLGLVATGTQAVSIVMIKPILDSTPLIWGNFNSTLQVNWRWDNTPSPGNKRSDTIFLLTLGYSFDL